MVTSLRTAWDVLQVLIVGRKNLLSGVVSESLQQSKYRLTDMFALSQQSCSIRLDFVHIIHMASDDAAREARRNLLRFVPVPSIVLQLGLDLIST